MKTEMTTTITAWLEREAAIKAMRPSRGRRAYLRNLNGYIARLAEQNPAEYDAAIDARYDAARASA